MSLYLLFEISSLLITYTYKRLRTINVYINKEGREGEEDKEEGKSKKKREKRINTTL